MADMLQDAINLIRQGKKHEARGMLEVLLRTNPQDVSNWFWYAETLDTIDKRVKVLELCLKANPGNAQAEKALNIMRARLSEASPPPAPVETKPAIDWDSKPAAFAEPEANAAESESAFDWDDEEKRSRPSATLWGEEPQTEAAAPINWDDEPETKISSTIDWDAIEQQQQQEAPKPEAWQYEPAPEEVATPEREPQRPSYRFYDVWLTAVTTSNEREYRALLVDRDAGQMRAYEWMAYIGLLSGLLLPLMAGSVLNQPDMKQLLGDINPTLLIVLVAGAGAIFSCISAVLGLMINGAVQFLIAKALGGKGTFSETVYALGAYLAPMTIVSTIIGVIPYVNCISPIIAIYAIVLNVRALKAAHFMDTTRAALVIFLPGILILIVVCLIGLFAMPALGDVLSSMP